MLLQVMISRQWVGMLFSPTTEFVLEIRCEVTESSAPWSCDRLQRVAAHS